MNLQFIYVSESDTHIVQKANVTYSKPFWRAWTMAQIAEKKALSLHCPPPEKSLRSLITLKRESIDGRDYWFAYRSVPKNKEIHQVQSFPLSYTLSNRSLLLPFQPKAVAHICNSLVTNGAAADGSDTGIGKTYIAIACARDLRYRPAIICKKAGIATWKKACGHFGIDPLFIVNWEFAKSSNFRYVKRRIGEYTGIYQYTWCLPKATLLIFDEAHSANHVGSQNCALYMASKGLPSIACSATFSDRPERLYPLLSTLGAVTKDSFDAWIKSRSDYFLNENDKVDFICDTEAMKDFNKILYPRYGYRLSYEDKDVKKYFPESVYQTEIVSIGSTKEKEQNALYQEMLKKAEEYKQLGLQAKKLVEEMRYRQSTELLKSDSLIEIAQNYLEQGHSVCIFVNYRETLAYLAKKMKTKSLIFGNQDNYGINREKVIEDFQDNKINLVLCMVDAGGQSISLHDLHGGHPRVSLICPTYDSIKLKQVLGRTYRAGSKTTPIMKLVYAAGTVEEKVSETVNKKLSNISALNDGDLMEEDFFKMGERVCEEKN